jgi:hypothetical protein
MPSVFVGRFRTCPPCASNCVLGACLVCCCSSLPSTTLYFPTASWYLFICEISFQPFA